MHAGVAGLSAGVHGGSGGPPVQPRRSLRSRLNAAAAERNAAAQWTGLGSLMAPHFVRGPVRRPADSGAADGRLRELLHLDMLERGFFLARRGMVALSLEVGAGGSTASPPSPIGSTRARGCWRSDVDGRRMIDNPAKTERLLARLQAALPVPATPTPELVAALREAAAHRGAADLRDHLDQLRRRRRRHRVPARFRSRCRERRVRLHHPPAL